MIEGKFSLPRWEPPMSVVAAMWESENSILLGSDSALTEPDPYLPLKFEYKLKLRKHPTAPLAWGVVGNPTIGAQFAEWLEQYSWPPVSRLSFQDECAGKFAGLNSRVRELIKLAGAKPKPTDFSDLIVAGWLDAPTIFSIGDRGKIDIIGRERRLEAAGSGAYHAKLIYIVLDRIGFKASEEFKFGLTLETASGFAVGCAPPVIIWRVERNGVTALDPKDLKP
jgi:hypothetical protein